MKLSLKVALAAASMFAASPALADIIAVEASSDQGILVHANGGAADEGNPVSAVLGANGTIQVFFSGSTSGGNPDSFFIQNGSGQADITGAEIAGPPGNDFEAINSLTIALQNSLDFTFIELGIQGVAGTELVFTLYDETNTPFVFQTNPGAGQQDCDKQGPTTGCALGNGDTKFAFRAINGQSIDRLTFTAPGGDSGGVQVIKQVRITPVPEPTTWAMMLIGFGAVGYSLRRRRGGVALPQLA